MFETYLQDFFIWHSDNLRETLDFLVPRLLSILLKINNGIFDGVADDTWELNHQVEEA